MHTAIHGRQKAGSKSKTSLKDKFRNLDPKDRRSLIIESIKFILLICLLAFAVYYISWLNSAASFPEFS